MPMNGGTGAIFLFLMMALLLVCCPACCWRCKRWKTNSEMTDHQRRRKKMRKARNRYAKAEGKLLICGGPGILDTTPAPDEDRDETKRREQAWRARDKMRAAAEKLEDLEEEEAMEIEEIHTPGAHNWCSTPLRPVPRSGHHGRTLVDVVRELQIAREAEEVLALTHPGVGGTTPGILLQERDHTPWAGLARQSPQVETSQSIQPPLESMTKPGRNIDIPTLRKRIEALNTRSMWTLFPWQDRAGGVQGARWGHCPPGESKKGGKGGLTAGTDTDTIPSPGASLSMALDFGGSTPTPSESTSSRSHTIPPYTDQLSEVEMGVRGPYASPGPETWRFSSGSLPELTLQHDYSIERSTCSPLRSPSPR